MTPRSTPGPRHPAGARASLALASLAMGCSVGARPDPVAPAPSPPVVVATADAAPASPERMLALVEDTCGGCHDVGMRAPPLGERLLSDRALAMRSALMLSARRMPPPPAALPPAVRGELIGWLCDVAHAGARCRADLLAPSPAARFRDPRAFKREADALGAPRATPDDAEALIDESLTYLDEDKQAFDLHPTYQALIILKAAVRCAPAAPVPKGDATPPAARAIDRACLAKILGDAIVDLAPDAEQVVGD